MANNRMYLKCSCGEQIFLGKTFGSGYYYTHYGNYPEKDLEERLNNFLDKHAFCEPYEKNFKLIYEH